MGPIAPARSAPVQSQRPLDDPTAQFAATVLGGRSVASELSFRAGRAWAWTEQTHSGAVQRLMLERRVEVTIGASRFEAERAVVWLRRVGPAEWQVYAYFEEARATGFGQSRVASDILDLSARVSAPDGPRLRPDLLLEGPPNASDTLDRARTQLGLHLNPPPAPPPRPAPVPPPRPAPPPVMEAPAPRPIAPPAAPVLPPPAEAAVQAPVPAEPGAIPPRAPAPQTPAPVAPSPVAPAPLTPAPVAPSPVAPAPVAPASEANRATITTMEPMRDAPSRAGSVAPTPIPTAGHERLPVRAPADVPTGPPQDTPAGAPALRPTIDDQPRSDAAPSPAADGPQPTLDVPQPASLFPQSGRFSFQAGHLALTGGEEERTLVLTGGVVMQFIDLANNRVMLVQAERAVAFLSPGSIEQLRAFSRDDVRGVYLEGAVRATDGRYSLTGPRVYYDVTGDRALIPEARLSTYDQQRGIPLIVRATRIRQQGEGLFVAEQADVANTTFAKPHFSVGADVVEVEQYTREDGSTGSMVDAHDVTLDARGVPYFYWPRWVGDPERFPLTSLGVTNSSSEGVGVRTGWDVFSLTGKAPPDGLDAELFLDVFSKRGFATGGALDWSRPNVDGAAFVYVIPDDNGIDNLPSGEEVDAGGTFRGGITAEQRWELNDQWTLTAELAHFGDPRFVPGVLDPLQRTHREFTTRAHLARRSENSLLAIEARSHLDDFMSNDSLVQSPGYGVDRLPEVRYWRLADDPLRRWMPGWLVYHSEHRAGQLALNFQDVSAASIGYPTDFGAREALGIAAEDSVADRLRAAGLHEKSIWRGDTRHEVQAPLDAGPLRIVPFLVGRGTIYDTTFPAYSAGEDDRARAWGGAGVRVATTIQRVDTTIDSALFDVHQMRHIIEPGVTVWHADTTIDRVNLPEYDREVEGLVEGTMLRAGIDQTWQTKRGGPGRWRSVDWLTLRTEWVWSSSDVDERSPIGRWYEDRPELSNPGEFFHAAATMQLSEVLGIAGETTHDIDRRSNAYSAAGVVLRHGWNFDTSLGVRHVDALSSTFLDGSVNYQLTSKYRVGGSASYDPSESDFQRIEARLERAFPNVILGASVSHNNISGETSFGFVFQPLGLGQGLSVRGGDDAGRRGSGFGG